MEQLEVVLQAVCALLDRGILLRMWLINPGPDTPKIYQWLRHQGWHREILIFDGFDVLEDLVCIADLVIASNPACSLQYSTRLVFESQVPRNTTDEMVSIERIAHSAVCRLADSSLPVGGGGHRASKALPAASSEPALARSLEKCLL
jgi:hypothetical protein